MFSLKNVILWNFLVLLEVDNMPKYWLNQSKMKLRVPNERTKLNFKRVESINVDQWVEM